MRMRARIRRSGSPIGFMGPPVADFRRLWAATAVSVLGTYAAAIALAIRTYQDTHQPIWVSAVFAAEFVPIVVIGLVFGARLDRLRPRRALVGSDLVNAAAFAALVVVHRPVAVVALAVVAGAATGVFRPIALGVVPVVAGERNLDAANGAMAAVDTTMSSVGQASAGIVVATLGAGAVLGANAVSFGISALLIGGCSTLGGVAGKQGSGGNRWSGQLRRSIGAVRVSPPLLLIACTWIPMLLAVGVVNSVEVPLILGPFAAGAALTGLVLAGGTASQVLGSLLAPRAGARLGRLYPGALAVMAAAMFTCGVSPTLALVMVAFVVSGVANGLAVVHNRSALQRGTEPGERMAVIALLIGVGAIMTALGAAGGGVLASAVSPRAAFVAAGVVGAASVVPAVVLARRARAGAGGRMQGGALTPAGT